MPEQDAKLREYGRQENDHVLANIFNPRAASFDDLEYVQETAVDACRQAASAFGDTDPLHVEALINAALFYWRRRYDPEAAKPYVAEARTLLNEVSQPNARGLATLLTAVAVLVGILEEDRAETFSVSALVGGVAPNAFRDATDTHATLTAVEIYRRMVKVARETKKGVIRYLVSEIGRPLAIEIARDDRSGAAALLKDVLLPLNREVWDDDALQIKIVEREARWLGWPEPDAQRKRVLDRLVFDLKVIIADINTISKHGEFNVIKSRVGWGLFGKSKREQATPGVGPVLLQRTREIVTKLAAVPIPQLESSIEGAISTLETSINELGFPGIDTWIIKSGVEPKKAGNEALLPAFRALACLHASRASRDIQICQDRAIQYLNAFLNVYYSSDEIITEESKDIARVQLAELFGNRIGGEREDNANEILVHTDSLELSESKEPYYWAIGKLYRGVARLTRQELKLHSGAVANTFWEQMDSQVAQRDFYSALGVFKDDRYVWDRRLTEVHLARCLTAHIPADTKIAHKLTMVDMLMVAEDTFTPAAYPEQWLAIQLCRARLAEALKNDRVEGLREYPIDILRSAQRYLTDVSHPALWGRIELEIARLCAASAKEEVRRRAPRHFENCAEASPDLAQERLEALIELANVHVACRDYERALEPLERAIDVGEHRFANSDSMNARHVAISMMEGLSRTLSYCNFRAGRLTEAVIALDSGKCRLLRDCLQIWRMDLSACDETTRVNAQRLRSEIRELKSRAYGGMAYLEDTNRLITARREFKALVACGAPSNKDASTLSTLSEIASDAAIVMPLAFDHGGVAYIVLPGVNTMQPACVVELQNFSTNTVAETLFNKSDGWFAAYSERTKDQDTDQKFKDILERVASFLWDTVFASVCTRLAEFNVKEIILSPSGGMQFLPVHSAGLTRTDGCGATRLIDNFRVRIVPSAGILPYLRPDIDSNGPPMANLLVAGVSEYADLPSLPGVVTEVKAVARDLKTDPLLEDQVTVDALSQRVAHAAIVHLACHGSNWAESPNFRMSWEPEPVLRLSNSGVSFQDILSGWHLEHTRLVTLSACDTGVVDFSRAWDEFEGITHVLLQAGARAVVSSLWSVDDESTALLMVRFYQNQLDRNMSPAESLAEAQRWLRDSTHATLMKNHGDIYSAAASDLSPDERPFAHLFYWAPFYVVG